MNALSREVAARVHEFHSPVEICMLLNAMTKLGVVDLELFTRWCKHIQTRMSQEPFHVRDLSVIASALARVVKHHTVAEGSGQKKGGEVIHGLGGKYENFLEMICMWSTTFDNMGILRKSRNFFGRFLYTPTRIRV